MADATKRAVAVAVDHEAERSLVAKYETSLVRHLTRDTALIPAADLPALIDALKEDLQPATQRQVVEIIALVGGAWPYAHQRANATALDLFARQLAEDLAPFPHSALIEAIRQLRRTLKFSPSIAEIIECATSALAERQWRLRVAEAHQAEHTRRQAKLERLVAANAAAFGGWGTDDVHALEVGWSRCSYLHWRGVEIRDVLAKGGARMLSLLSVVAVAGRVLPLVEAGRLKPEVAAEAIWTAQHDFETARQIAVYATQEAEPARDATAPTISRTSPAEVLHRVVVEWLDDREPAPMEEAPL